MAIIANETMLEIMPNEKYTISFQTYNYYFQLKFCANNKQ